MINDPQFELFLDSAIRDEGGYTTDPNDTGNWTGGKVGVGELKGTKWGISAATYPHLDIKNLTPDQAGEIFEKDWWLRYGFNRLPSPIGAKLCNLAINTGSRPEVILLQQAIQMLGPDVALTGIIDMGTATAAKRCDVTALYAKICDLAEQHYHEIVDRNPKDARYLKGWVRRAREQIGQLPAPKQPAGEGADPAAVIKPQPQSRITGVLKWIWSRF